MTVVMLFGMFVIPASAASDYSYWGDKTSGVSISGYNGSSAKLVISAKIDGAKVVGIESLKSSDGKANTKLTSITIPASVEKITSTAFDGMSALKEIKVEKGNKKFKSVDGVLYKCYDDSDIWCVYRVPEGMSGKVKLGKIELNLLYTNKSTFLSCTKVTEYSGSAKDGCLVIDGVVYSGVNSLRLVAFPGARSGVFRFPESYVNANGDTVTVHIDAVAVDDESFSSNTRNITAFEMPKEKKSDDYTTYHTTVDGVLFSSFNGDYRLVAYPGAKADSSYTIPSKVTYIYNSVFNKCAKLTKLTFPKTMAGDVIPMIKDCPKLKTISLPTTMKEKNVLAQGFYNLPKLTSLTFPKNIYDARLSEIQDCPKLKTIKIPKSLTINQWVLDQVKTNIPMASIVKF